MASPIDPYGGVPDLQTALGEFVKGVKSYKLADTLATANDKVQQIKGSAIKDTEKRAALNDVANGLVLQMTGMGASAAETANVFHTLKPALPASADQAVLQGLLENNPEMIGQGRTAQLANAQDNIAIVNAQHKNALQLETMREANALKVAGIKANAKNSKPLSPDELKQINSLDKGFAGLSGLKEMVKRNPGLVGPLAGNVPGRGKLDPKYGAFTAEMRRVLDEYRVAVTGAGASPGELKMLERANPTDTDTPSTFLRKLQQVETIGKRNRAILLKNYGKAGREVSGFEEPDAPAAASATIPGLTF